MAINETEKTNMKIKKVILYLATVVSVSAVLSSLALFLINDAFAVTAESGEVTVSVSEGESARDIARSLKRSGAVKSGTWLRIYLAMRGKSLDGVKSGSYTLSKTGGFDGIYRCLTSETRRKRTEVTVVIPEGSTVEDVLTIVCDDNGICSRDELVETIRNGDFSKYDFVEALSGDRPYRLEGYLYPDTYCFYSDSSPYLVIDKMLSNFNAKFDEKYRRACRAKGLTTDDAVKIASIIEKEARYVSDYPKVSSVIYNRKNSISFGGRLQSDATLTYSLGRPMTAGDKESDDPYNSYKYAGLPPSAVCSPDFEAISYAIYPDKTGYYYFVSRPSGSMLYAESYEAHKRNIELVKREAERDKA